MNSDRVRGGNLTFLLRKLGLQETLIGFVRKRMHMLRRVDYKP